MNEKKLIEGKLFSTKWLPIIGAVIAVISFIYALTEDTVLPLFWFWMIGFPILLVTLFIYWWVGRCKIIVTDKRVYGKSAFGKQVDLPLDLISAVGTLPILSGVGVYTSSGKIVFCGLKNSSDVFNVISELLRARQDRLANTTNTTPKSDTDELKKYKDLLDSGVITQEEFDAKKKQLLGL